MSVKLFDFLEPAIKTLAEQGELLASVSISSGLTHNRALRVALHFEHTPEIKKAFADYDKAKNAEAIQRIVDRNLQKLPEEKSTVEREKPKTKIENRLLAQAVKRSKPLSLFSRYTAENTGLTDEILQTIGATAYNCNRHLRERNNRHTGENPKGGNFVGLERGTELADLEQAGILAACSFQRGIKPLDCPDNLFHLALQAKDNPSKLAAFVGKYIYFTAYRSSFVNENKTDLLESEDWEKAIAVQPEIPLDSPISETLADSLQARVFTKRKMQITIKTGFELWLANIALRFGKNLCRKLAQAMLFEVVKPTLSRGKVENAGFKQSNRLIMLQRDKKKLAQALPDKEYRQFLLEHMRRQAVTA